MITGRENSALLPLISDPTFSPPLAHLIRNVRLARSA
jgi:hypothetical protein